MQLVELYILFKIQVFQVLTSDLPNPKILDLAETESFIQIRIRPNPYPSPNQNIFYWNPKIKALCNVDTKKVFLIISTYYTNTCILILAEQHF